MSKLLKRSLSVILALIMIMGAAPVASALNEVNELQSDEYLISDVEMNGLTAKVKLACSGKCTVIVAVVNEETGETFATGNKSVAANTKEASVSLTASQLPENYAVKAFLIGEKKEALCENYCSVKGGTSSQSEKPSGAMFTAITGNIYMIYSVTNYSENFSIDSSNLKFINQATCVNGEARFKLFETAGTTTVIVGDFGKGIEAIPAKITNVYTAKLMVDGKLFKEVQYNEGQETIEDLPAVPEKEGYIGKWEEYTLKKGGTVINAVYTLAPGVYVAKLMVDGKLYKEITYKEGQKSISLPEVPKKEGYTGEWESYSLVKGGTVINAVYTLIPVVYTAKLMVDGKLYKEITYKEGQKSIDLPDVPEKKGYTGEWESYSLVKGGTVINAIYTPVGAGKLKSVSVGDVEVIYKRTAKIVPEIIADSGVKYTTAYTSSNPSVATVDKDGNITTLHKGITTVTCTVKDAYGNTIKDNCTVTVKFQWWQWIIWIVLLGFIWY